MTRQVSITNMSNWDGEDYLVVSNMDPRISFTLKPGESCTFTPKASELISFVAKESKKPEPFYVPKVVNGTKKMVQVFPKQLVLFEE